MKPDKKSGSPVGGLIAGILLLGVVSLGVITGYMPLAGANNQGVELARWPIVFWVYTVILGALGIIVVIWSVRAMVKARREG